MSTSSTLPAVKAALVSLLQDALSTSGVSGGQIPVEYAWPGPDSADEMVFLGRHPDTVGNPLTESGSMRSEIPTIKAGRKQRQETYTVDVTCWSFRPDLTAGGAEEAETRGFQIFAEVEDVLADDPTLGLSSIQHAVLTDVGVALIPFQSGWASVLVASVTVNARLT